MIPKEWPEEGRPEDERRAGRRSRGRNSPAGWMRGICAGLLVTLAGCASSGARGPLQEGGWAEFVAGAGTDVEEEGSEELLYHLAIVHLVPGSEVYDPMRAEGLLNRMRSRFPEGEYILEARILSEQLLRIRTIEGEVHRAMAARDSVRAVLVATAEREEAAIERAETAESQGTALRERMTGLEAELVLRDEQIRTLERTLDQLKQIDLRRSPPGSRPLNGGSGSTIP